MLEIVTIGPRSVGRATRRVEIHGKLRRRVVKREQVSIQIHRMINRHCTPPIESGPSSNVRRKRSLVESVHIMAETIFGVTITLSSGRVIPTRWVGEQHVTEDLGFIPSFADWGRTIRPEPWMGRTQKIEADLDPHLLIREVVNA